MAPPLAARPLLVDLGAGVRRRFEESRTLLSFEEYLDLFVREPRAQLRTAAQYLRDALDFYGTVEVATPAGPVRRFKLFDCPFDGGEGRVAGHEEVQDALYRQLSNFVQAGRVNKLLLLHGPNGTAKSSLSRALLRGLEDYSQRPEGARYRFNWVFPSEKTLKGSIGFGSGATSGPIESYAHLDGESIEARLVDELRDPPLFLLPREERRRLLELATAPREGDAAPFVVGDYMRDGDLSHRNRAIFDALLSHYGGDYLKVLRHVQVERFYVSRNGLSASAVIEPAMAVDADFRQVAADRNVASLPPALQNLALYETQGPLVHGNRGLVEFSDLLKRPLEAFKYLLTVAETNAFTLGPFVVHLDAVFIASSNEKHLAAFKEIPDFASFKGRIELVRVPYLRRWSVEREIYEQQLERTRGSRPVAPHTTRVAAMWAVLTRLRRPAVDRYKGAVRALVDDLGPLEKLHLYDSGRAPDRLSLAQANELRQHLPQLWKEFDAGPGYEGRIGASAREMKTVLLNAAQSTQFRTLSPIAVLEELRELVRDRSVYDFLQLEKADGYHAPDEFIRLVEDDWLDLVDEEVRESMGLIGEAQVRELFDRYVLHAKAMLTGEKLPNRHTGEPDAPDADLLAEVESVVMSKGHDAREFRRNLVGSIGAYRLDHPDGPLDTSAIFPELLRKLRDHSYEERRRTLKRYKEHVLFYFGDDRTRLGDKDRQRVEQMLGTLEAKYGYPREAAREVVLHLLKRRYAD